MHMKYKQIWRAFKNNERHGFVTLRLQFLMGEMHISNRHTKAKESVSIFSCI